MQNLRGRVIFVAEYAEQQMRRADGVTLVELGLQESSLQGLFRLLGQVQALFVIHPRSVSRLVQGFYFLSQGREIELEGFQYVICLTFGLP